MTTVLIVEDEPDILELIELAFLNAGYETLTATNGPSARALIAQRRPDLIVLDHMMPLMTGARLAQLLRADPEFAAIPIILLTAAGEIHKDLTVVDRWLSKPFSPRKLLGHAETLLRRSATSSTSPAVRHGAAGGAGAAGADRAW